MCVLHCESRYEIDRSGSPDRDGDRHIDIASNRIQYRQIAGAPWTIRSLVDASHGDGKRGGQLKASCFISTKVDPGDDVEIVICSPRFAAACLILPSSS
jgi:hypothetical protein